MSKHNVADIRNIVFCGHGSSGKTTLIDHLLFITKAVNREGSVDQHTSICDFDEEEKHHRYTIESKVAHFEYGGKRFNVLDTPGYPDYIGQTIGALRAADTAAIVINAHAGIEVNTRRVFHEAGDAGLGRIIVINKLDTENIDFPKLVGNIQELWGKKCVPLNVPLGVSHDFRGVASTQHVPADIAGAAIDPNSFHDSLIESIIEVDEEATARYFDGVEPTDEEVSRLIVQAVAEGTLIPIVCVAGKSNLGVTELLDALTICALPPDRVRRTATNPAGEQVELQADPAGPLAAQVFKTRIDPFVQKLSFVRIYSGTFKKDDTVHVSGARKSIKLPQLLEVQANETKPIEVASAGDIVAVAKTDDLHTGTSLGEFELPAIRFPTPMVGLAATPKARGDEAKLSGALHKVLEEDPTFHLDHDLQTKELVITGMSELHLQVIQERLKRRDKVEVDTKDPKIPYRETIQTKAEGSYRHKKQTGGRGQFGEVHIRMFPLPGGTKIEDFANKSHFPSMREYHYDPIHNFLWVDSIVGGSIPNNFLPAVEKGFKERLDRGVVAGHRIENVCVEVHFGKHHPVDSSEAAFKTAGSMAFRNVFQQARPSLLEPIVTLHVTVPAQKLGDINSDMSGRRGRVIGMDSAGGDLTTVTAEVPLAEVTSYARSLSSITGGQGSYTMEFARYDVVPGNIQKEIMEKAVLHPEEEE
ncbi:MAG: elongation factor G [Pirellulales bacterium]|nr:elongation factor G [Pirellulales bacterium]